MPVTEDTPLTGPRSYQSIDVEHQVEDAAVEQITETGRFRSTKSRLLLAVTLVAGMAMMAGFSSGMKPGAASMFNYYADPPMTDYYAMYEELADEQAEEEAEEHAEEEAKEHAQEVAEEHAEEEAEEHAEEEAEEHAQEVAVEHAEEKAEGQEEEHAQEEAVEHAQVQSEEEAEKEIAAANLQ